MKSGVDFIGVAVVFRCNDGKGNFLLHKRSKNCRDECGAWDWGGGEAHFGFTLEENVLREVFEEYGCKGEIQEQGPAYTLLREHEGVKTHWVCIPFFVKVDPSEVKINEPEAMDEIGWFRLDTFPEPLHSGVRLAFSMFKEDLERYGK